MKNFSLQRLAFVLWFGNYSFIAMINFIFGNGRPPIMSYIVEATVMVVIELICLGLIEDTL